MSLRRTLHLTLEDDCVFSERTASEGGHRTLRRIPGSVLLGAAATQLYRELDPDQAFEAFHSGRLRFLDGLPLDETADPAWPVPICWHHRKAASLTAPAGILDHKQIFNFLHADKMTDSESQSGESQAKQFREGYVTSTGRWVKPRTTYRLKTAIAPGTGRAAESQLFGYESLSRGQRFIAALEADDDFPQELFERVAAVLIGRVLAGRSRSAEYGRVLCEAGVKPWPRPPRCSTVANTVASLWLLSDLAPCDASGYSNGDLGEAALGLPQGSRIDWGRTFLRSRRYSPWNAARQGYDTERAVFNAGGVICVELPLGCDREALARTLASGVGMFREAGLGQVALDACLLATLSPDFVPIARTESVPNRAPPDAADHPLLSWLRQRPDGGTSTLETRAEAVAKACHAAIEVARNAYGYAPDATHFFPSASQWGRVLAVAGGCDGTELYKALFVGSHAAIKRDGKGWSMTYPADDGLRTNWPTLHDLIRDQVSSEDRADARLVQQVAHRLKDRPSLTTR